MRSAVLRASGVSGRELTESVARGALLRPRRGWIAHPGADAMLIAAARDGVILTCITQARRLGLWVLSEDRPHVAVAAHAGHATRRGVVAHWRAPVIPRPPHTLADGVENVLIQVACCQPREVALAVWESALQRGLAQREVLGGFTLPRAARRLLADAVPWSDSGLETMLTSRLRWLRLPLRQQIWIAGRRVDLLIGERLVLQADGGHHVGSQRDDDNGHDALLALMGYHVIRVSYDQIVNHWAHVQDLVMRAVAQGLHRRRA